MDYEGYFLISPILKKINGPYSKNMVDPRTGKRFTPDKDMLVLAPPDYPQLANGLEIGAFYEEVHGPDGDGGILHGLDSLEEYFRWCEKSETRRRFSKMGTRSLGVE